MTISIDKQFFSTGLVWKEFIDKEAKTNLNLWKDAYELEKKVADVIPSPERLAKTAPYWLVIAEDWCGDSLRAVPVLARIAEKTGADLRIWLRDRNVDLMSQYLTQGRRKIPVVVFFDITFREVCRWIERPTGNPKVFEQLQQELTQKGYNIATFNRTSLLIASDICGLLG